jgi:hypothetical protein
MRNMVWEGDTKNTTIYVFDIEKSRTNEEVSVTPPVAVFETEPLFAYHHVNAYETQETGTGGTGVGAEAGGTGGTHTGETHTGGTETHIVLDVLAYKNADIVNHGEAAYAYIDTMMDAKKVTIVS